MAKGFRKLYLLVWKNFILQIRRPIGTLVEILLPVCLLALLVMARKLIVNKEVCFSSFTPVNIPSQDFNGWITNYIKELEADGIVANNLKLAYYPINDNTTRILNLAVNKMKNISLATQSVDGVKFTSKEQVINDAEEFVDTYIAAIVFENVPSTGELPDKLEYSIRLHHSTAKYFDETINRASWFTKWVYPFFQRGGPRQGSFYLSPFLLIQYHLDSAILQFYKNDSTSQVATHIQQLPYPDYIEDTFITLIQGTMPTIFVLSYIYNAVMIVKELVAERQFRLKESMKMMGLANWMHWTAWFIKIFVFFLITIILQLAMLKGGKIFEFADTGVVFVFLLLYMIASIMFLFAISTVFSNAVRGMLFAAVLWFGSLAPYLSFAKAEDYEELSTGNKFASCLLPNTCLGVIVQIISRRESAQVGADWSNIGKTTSVDDNFTLAAAFAVLLLDIVVYGIITWYIENVFPGEFGIPRPFYFPFQPTYWCGPKGYSSFGSDENMRGNKVHPGGANFEDEPENLAVGVSIKNLRKVFKGSTGTKVAVDGLSVNMYKGQITALLGHNGAGKTTTMSILTGLYTPTYGNATINGHSILNQMDAIRESLGLCPQHNVLFDRLTVKEHLEFYSALKGIDKAKAKIEIDQMIKDIQLVDKANQASSTLSGGMKRKLCCAIALIGGSETVFLDEPTSGMDPYARRATWDLLQKYRGGKTIILTTHFMDEADHLGDRIAIMADGQLRCCGSSLFLKKRYGVGYHMTLVKDSEFKENETRSLISSSIPTAKLVGNIAAEISYILQEDSSPQFKGLFEVLEDRRGDYGISSFGISVTTLEEVFLKVGEGGTVSVEKFDDQVDDEEVHLHEINRSESVIEREALLTGCALKASHFKAMFIKRFLNSKREKKAIVSQILLPLLLVLCGLLLSISSDSQKNDLKLHLNLNILKDKSEELHAFYSDFSSLSPSDKARIKNISKDAFTVSEVNLMDRTIETKTLESKNSGNNMSLPYSTNQYEGVISSNKKECCNYKYLLLNPQCRSNIASYTNLCGSESPNFGYKDCLTCANSASKCGNTPPPMVLFNITPSRLYFQEYILEDSGKNFKNYFNEKISGFSIESDNSYTVWYSNQAWHTLPSAFSVVSNILLKYHLNDAKYGIIANNHPLPRNTKEKSEAALQNAENLTLVIFVTMAAAFIAASFVTFLVTERTSKAKHVQFVSGVDSLSYWGATYCWDFINFLVPAFLILIIFAAFNLDDYDGELGEVFFVLLLFGISVLPFVYFLNFLFSSALIAYAVIANLLMVISLAAVIAVFICRATKEDEVADILHYLFLLLPTYAFPQALADIAANVRSRKACTAKASSALYCARNNVGYHENSLSWELPGVGVHCLYMFIEACFFFILTLLIEEGFFLGGCSGKSAAFTIREGEDEDVRAEREKVFNLTDEQIDQAAVVVKDLTKVYRTNGMMAVDHLNVTIPKGECFGLLGVNGAGKTTTFGMLTGELGITDGTAYLHGYNLQTHLNSVQQRLGYCPQFDALVERLTGREMLNMFARLRGIPSHMIEDVTKSAILQLNLSKWADKLCGDYSGGNKRKLSTAMALVGNPAVVFLDEPTSGMDPASRRFLWNTLSTVLNEGRSIVLTSHSMEECEALCTRLVIMVNGQFKCLGSIQHLKSRFGQGYTIMMKISGQVLHQNGNGTENLSYHNDNGNLSVPTGMSHSTSTENILTNTTSIKAFMNAQFPGSLLIEDRQGLLQYQIINPNVRWSQLFGELEQNAARLGVVDYSVSQTSLEQVFINFAKQQHFEDRVINKSCCSCSCF